LALRSGHESFFAAAPRICVGRIVARAMRWWGMAKVLAPSVHFREGERLSVDNVQSDVRYPSRRWSAR